MNTKINLTIIAFILSMSYNLFGQNPGEIDLNDLEIPTSPAFILLDVAPTSIERPTTFRKFTASVLENVKTNQGFPRDYAIEFAPYWFFKRKSTLTAQEHYGYKNPKDINGKKKLLVGSQAKYSSISFATVKTSIDSTKIDSVTNFSVGFRTTLIHVKRKKLIDTINLAITDWNLSQDAISTYFNRKESDSIKFYQEYLQQTSSTLCEDLSDPYTCTIPESIDRSIRNYWLEKEKDSLSRDTIGIDQITIIRAALERKPVFALDLAGATNWAFANNISTGSLNRAGVWSTMSVSAGLYKKENFKNGITNYLNFYAAFRYMYDKNFIDLDRHTIESNIIDAGGRMEFQFANSISFSGEGIYRKNITNNELSTFRASGLITVNAYSPMRFTIAFGKNFGDTDNAIIQVGIKWGLNGAQNPFNLGS